MYVLTIVLFVVVVDQIFYVGNHFIDVMCSFISTTVILKASSGPRYVVGCRKKIDKTKLTPSTRVALDMTTLTIMRILPREIDPVVFNMVEPEENAKNKTSFNAIGGLNEQIRELREVIELPLINPELFKRVGIKAPKGVLLYGPPGTGKVRIVNDCSLFFVLVPIHVHVLTLTHLK